MSVLELSLYFLIATGTDVRSFDLDKGIEPRQAKSKDISVGCCTRICSPHLEHFPRIQVVALRALFSLTLCCATTQACKRWVNCRRCIERSLLAKIWNRPAKGLRVVAHTGCSFSCK